MTPDPPPTRTLPASASNFHAAPRHARNHGLAPVRKDSIPTCSAIRRPRVADPRAAGGGRSASSGIFFPALYGKFIYRSMKHNAMACGQGAPADILSSAAVQKAATGRTTATHNTEGESMDGYREKLLGLDRERLVDALVKIAARPETAEDVIERLLNTPDEKRHRAKRAIADLKRGDQYYGWRASHAFALELEGVVETIVESAASPEEGIELLAEFFEADRDAIECADDSDGQIGAVYSMDATHAFIAFGQQCEDKAWLAERVLELFAGDDYGLREDLLESARDMFPEDSLRAMAERLWMMAEAPSGNHSADYRRRKCFVGVQTLARQLGDAPCTKATRAAWPRLRRVAARRGQGLPLETGDAGAALRLVKSVVWARTIARRKTNCFSHPRRQKNRAAWEEVAWRIFRRRPPKAPSNNSSARSARGGATPSCARSERRF